ncbi:MAG TPA: iron donor protein CyaY [Bryobacteraceae bacterium]|jgi:CyaY protein|nr:iron donor protein CyaY [Bryobacteraceae bacterium]
MLDDQQFRKLSDEALLNLQRALERAAERYEFDVDRNEGALTVEFEDPPSRFVVSPNSPVRQIWVSARVRSFKLDWDPARSAFVLSADGRSLQRLMEDVIGEQIGASVSL